MSVRTIFVFLGPVLCALSVLAGAFGAHALRARLDSRSLELWETAARYLMYGGLGVTLIGLAAMRWEKALFGAAGWILLLGALIFSGTVAALALGAPRWLGGVTPLGGLLMIVGFLLFAWSAFQV